MSRFHINGQGVPAPCRALKGKCPFGGSSGFDNHYNNIEEAQRAIDLLHEKEYNILPMVQCQKENEELRVMVSRLTNQIKKEKTESREINIKLNNLKNQLLLKRDSGELFTQEEADDRAKMVDEIMNSDFAKTLETDKIFADEEGSGYNLARSIKHEQMIDKLMSKFESVPCDGKVIIAAGMPGAGKTFSIKNVGKVDMSQYAMINSDDFKEMLAEEGMIPEVEGLTQMERVSLVHEESSYLFDEISNRLRSQNKNIILDLTCSSLNSTNKRLKSLKDSNYKEENVTIMCVKITPDIAEKRVTSRYKDGMNDYLIYKNNIGGRVVPSHVLASCNAKVGLVDPGSSNSPVYPKADTSSEQVYKLILANNPKMKGVMYDNNVDDRLPIIIEEECRR